MKTLDEIMAESGILTPQTSDYTQDFNASTVFQDTRFLDDVRKYFEARGETFANDQDMLARFYNDRSYGNLNSIGALEDVYDAHQGSEDQRARLKRLQFVYDNMPNFWQDGGAVDQFGAGETARSILGATLLDPVNLIGGAGAYGKAATAAARGAKTGRALWEGAKAGAKYEAAVNAPIEMGFDAMLQNRDIELGLQDTYSKTQTAFAGAAGAALGGVMGGLMGMATSIFARKNVRLGNEVYQRLDQAGIKPEHINRMSDQQLDEVLTKYGDKKATDQDKFMAIVSLPPRLVRYFASRDCKICILIAKINQFCCCYCFDY